MKKLLTLLCLCVLCIGSAWGESKTLTFDVSKNPGSWPTANSTTLTNYTYTLSGTDYTFALKNVKCNSGYLMLTSTAALGLPAIDGYKLTKVVAKNSGGCSTSVIVGISSSASSASYIDGGATQTWSKTSSTYNYDLSGTADNTVYYLYVTNKNAQIIELSLTYEGGTTTEKTAQNLSFGETNEFNVNLGEGFTAPTLTGAQTTVTYESSNTAVAEVDPSTGAVTIKGAGTTTITATAAEDDTYAEGKALYIINVTDPNSNEFVISYEDFNGQGTNSTGSNISTTKNNFVVSETNGYGNTSYSQLYAGGTLSITPSSGCKIKKIEITCSSDSYNGYQSSGTITANVGSLSHSGAVITWSGESNQTITLAHDKQIRLKTMTITYAEDIVLCKAPTITASCEFVSSQTVEITNNEEGAIVYYSINGGEYQVYNGSFSVTETSTVSTYAQKGEDKSYTVEATYTQKACAAPWIDCSENVVSITCATEGATIYYTIDGTEPSVSSTKYTESFTITETTTVKAIAVCEGYLDSEIKSYQCIYVAKTTYDTLEELVEETLKGNIASGTVITASFKDAIITGFYESERNSTKYRTGVYLLVNGTEIEMYVGYKDNNIIPDTWTVGGKISGTVTASWEYYKDGDIWEFKSYSSNTWKWADFEYTAPQATTLKINSAGWATASVPFAATISNANNDVKAYYVTIVEDKAHLNEISETIPAGAGVVLRGSAGDVVFTPSNDTPADLSSNVLQGNLQQTTCADLQALNAGCNIYVLNSVDGKIGFYRLKDEGNLKANSAYLPIQNDVEVKGFVFDFNDDVDAINSINADKKQLDGAIYNLNGQRLNSLQKGLNIVNGKKLFVK